MTETEALAQIADAINKLAIAVGSLATIGWLTLFFKTQNSNNSIEKLVEVIKKWVDKPR